MKFSKTLWLAALAVALSSFGLRADDSTTGRDRGNSRRGEMVRPGREAGVPNLGIPPKMELPEDLRKLVEQFRTQADAFATAQKELAKQIRGATAEEKEALKEQLKANREKFLEDTKQLRTDIRERVKELRDSLKDSRPIDAGAGEGRGKGRRGGN